MEVNINNYVFTYLIKFTSTIYHKYLLLLSCVSKIEHQKFNLTEVQICWNWVHLGLILNPLQEEDKTPKLVNGLPLNLMHWSLASCKILFQIPLLEYCNRIISSIMYISSLLLSLVVKRCGLKFNGQPPGHKVPFSSLLLGCIVP
jgi:hypothetical protein